MKSMALPFASPSVALPSTAAFGSASIFPVLIAVLSIPALVILTGFVWSLVWQ